MTQHLHVINACQCPSTDEGIFCAKNNNLYFEISQTCEPHKRIFFEWRGGPAPMGLPLSLGPTPPGILPLRLRPSN